MFLNYNQKYYYASSLNKLDQVFVCARTVGEWSRTMCMNKHEVKCSLLIARYLAVILCITLTAKYLFLN